MTKIYLIVNIVLVGIVEEFNEVFSYYGKILKE